MMTERRKVNRGLNLGDVLHLIQIATLVFTIGIAYQKFDASAVITQTHTQQLDRIEHYLSSRDPEYWNITRQNQ